MSCLWWLYERFELSLRKVFLRLWKVLKLFFLVILKFLGCWMLCSCWSIVRLWEFFLLILISVLLWFVFSMVVLLMLKLVICGVLKFFICCLNGCCDWFFGLLLRMCDSWLRICKRLGCCFLKVCVVVMSLSVCDLWWLMIFFWLFLLCRRCLYCCWSSEILM